MTRRIASIALIGSLCACARAPISAGLGSPGYPRAAGARPAVAAVEQPTRRSFTSADGHLSFRYPATWFVEDHWGESPSFLTSFKLGVRCCDMLDGDVKVDFWPASAADAREPALTDPCHHAEEAVTSCETHVIGGATWTWVRSRWADGSGTSLTAVGAGDGRTFVASGFVPDGALADAGIRSLREIYSSFRIH